jgi:hypothetical protein
MRRYITLWLAIVLAVLGAELIALDSPITLQQLDRAAVWFRLHETQIGVGLIIAAGLLVISLGLPGKRGPK